MRHLIAILLLATACTAAEGTASVFTLSDGSIDGPVSLDRAGTSTLEVVNTGEFNHTLIVTDGEGRVLGATEVLAPGTETAIQVDLDAGQYLVSCRLVTQDGEGNIIDHYELGMYQTLEVNG